MAKKKSNNTKAPIVKAVETTKPVENEPIKIVKPIEPKVAPKERVIYSGSEMMQVVSTGLNKHMNRRGKIHNVTCETAQILIDKGYATAL